MCCFRKLIGILGTAALTVSLTAIEAAAEGTRRNSGAFATRLRAILDDGFGGRATLADLEARAAGARRLEPKAPAADYAVGLVLLKRMRNEQAADRFLDALKLDPTYLPARHALFRVRLLRKDAAIVDELLSAAADVADRRLRWRDDRLRCEAAAGLGRVVAYLARPETKIVEPPDLQRAELEIESRLGPKFVNAYLDGIELFSRDYDRLLASRQENAAESEARRQRENAAKVARLQARSREAGRDAESLTLSKDELKAKFEKELTEIDGELKSLEQDYDALSTSAEKLGRMIEQTRLDIARLQTELNVRGIRGPEARLQPPLIQLQQELAGYQNRYADLERRAQQVTASARGLIVAREQTVGRYQAATGELAEKIEDSDRWKKLLVRKSQSVRETASAARDELETNESPIGPHQLFPLDYDAEAARLLEEYGPHPPRLKTAPSRNPAAHTVGK